MLLTRLLVLLCLLARLQSRAHAVKFRFNAHQELVQLLNLLLELFVHFKKLVAVLSRLRARGCDRLARLGCGPTRLDKVLGSDAFRAAGKLPDGPEAPKSNAA